MSQVLPTREIRKLVMAVLINSSTPLTFEELKQALEREGTRLLHDAFLVDALKEMRRDGSISFKQPTEGDIVEIERCMKPKRNKSST